jgi:D-alanyl-D-alanine carboxypeptidase
MSFEEYVQERIFTPTGMRFTNVGAPSKPEPDHALGYSSQKGRLVQVSSGEPFPAFSTVRDLLLFARALDSGKLISKAMLKEATTPPAGQRYGYGLMLMENGPIDSFGHGGLSAGVNAEVRIVPRLGYVVVGLSNFDHPAASRLIDFFLNRMPAE